VNPAELRVDRGELSVAVKTLAKSLRRKRLVEVIVGYEDGLLRLQTDEVTVMASAAGQWPGRARVHHRFFLALAESLPTGDPLPVRVEEGRFSVGRIRTDCVWQPDGQTVPSPVPFRAPADPTLRDLLTLSHHYTDTELNDRGWLERVAEARQERRERIRRALNLLEPLGVDEKSLEALVEDAINRTQDGSPR
jgi:hypothetical protein